MKKEEMNRMERKDKKLGTRWKNKIINIEGKKLYFFLKMVMNF